MAHTPDPLKSWAGFLSALTDKISNSLRVSAIGSVLALEDNRADVQLLAKTDENVSVVYRCYILDSIAQLKVGDVVLVSFTDLPLEEFDGSNRPYQVTLNRRHSLNDAVIVGRLR